MTKTQRQLLRTREKISLLYKVATELVRELQGNCDHKLTHPYKWEHDNGYGRQSYIEGKRCVFCGWIDRWNRGVFCEDL